MGDRNLLFTAGALAAGYVGLAPSMWTRLTDRATFENNQAGAHSSNALRFNPPVPR